MTTFGVWIADDCCSVAVVDRSRMPPFPSAPLRVKREGATQERKKKKEGAGGTRRYKLGREVWAARPIATRFSSTIHWGLEDLGQALRRVSEGNFMFERYTERARRVIFFARYEASQYGSRYIETEHLLLGLLREDRAVAKGFLDEVNAEAELRAEIEKHITPGERISTSVEVPLTSESKKVLTLAAEEADRLGHRPIGTEHLLLGLLRVEDSVAGTLLRERGVRAATIRERLARGTRVAGMNVQPKSSKRAMDTLESFLAGLKCQKAEDLSIFFAENSRFVDVYGKRWNREEIGKEFGIVFAPYAKKNAAYMIEDTIVDASDLLVAVVLWKNAILASMERVWMHRMSVVLVREGVPENEEWVILLAQVTPVQSRDGFT